MLREMLNRGAVAIVNAEITTKFISAIDRKVMGCEDPMARLDLNQQTRMDKWLNETLPALKEMGIDTTWGDAHL